MKPGSDTIKKTDSDPAGKTNTDDEGIDAFRILQVAATVVGLVLFIWFILRNVLHII